jgi:spore coat polysaccharide biosynthesis predicted glycosyltransferase SpsG/SAM-dependent methyltransferase
MRKRVLFCTAAGRGYGLGHLRRCLSLIEEAGSSFDPYVYVKRKNAQKLLQQKTLTGRFRYVNDIAEAPTADLVLFDMRKTGMSLVRKLVRNASVVSLDDRGASRKRAHLLIDSLPTLGGEQANYSGPEYLVLPRDLRKITPRPFSEKKGVLVSFGGSDPYDLTGFIVPVLNSIGLEPTVVRGPLSVNRKDGMRGEVLLNGPEELHELINDARVLITSFGLTMYEAFYLGTPVVLFNHTAYHFKLAEKVSELNLGYRRSVRKDRLRELLDVLLKDEGRLKQSAQRSAHVVDARGTERVVSLMEQTSRALRKDCLFAHGSAIAVKRSEEYTLFRCRRCKDFFLHEIMPKGPIYDDGSYFLEEYHKQYGRTYIEDRKNIELHGYRRIGCIETLTGGPGKLLDVGCALGFFLHCAQQKGWEARGVEISLYASRWGRENLHLDITTGPFLEVELKPEFFDAICFFFVAEHFKETEKLFEKANRILKKGGVIAFALPNRSGISYRMRRRKYLREHPRDHYFDTNPRNLTKILKRYGFLKKKIYITGIHPERFFESFGMRKRPKLLDRMYSGLARYFFLGDTFEYYGTKS